MQVWSRKNAVLLALTMATTLGETHTLAQASTEEPDKYQWLEDVNGERSMAWVNAENARSAKVLEDDPRSAGLAATALTVLDSPDRLQNPEVRKGEGFNTWQDAVHVHGILRRTSPTDYLKPHPDWHTVIDYDALSKQ